MSDEEITRRSFCGFDTTNHKDVRIVTSGPGVAICNGCAGIAADAIGRDSLEPDFPEHMGELVRREPDGKLRVPASEALLASGFMVTRTYTEGLSALVGEDHPLYPTFKRYRDDYERRLREMREE